MSSSSRRWRSTCGRPEDAPDFSALSESGHPTTKVRRDETGKQGRRGRLGRSDRDRPDRMRRGRHGIQERRHQGRRLGVRHELVHHRGQGGHGHLRQGQQHRAGVELGQPRCVHPGQPGRLDDQSGRRRHHRRSGTGGFARPAGGGGQGQGHPAGPGERRTREQATSRATCSRTTSPPGRRKCR